LGAFSVYLIRRTNREYSILIDDSVPVLHQIRDVDEEAAKVFQALIAGLVTQDPAKCAAALKRANDALDRGKQFRAKILASSFLRQNHALAREYEESSDAYEKEVTALLPRVTPENTADAERYRLEQLQSVYDRFDDVIERMYALVVDRTELTSDQYTAQTRSSSAVVLGLAGWPLLLAASIVVLTVVVVIIMLSVFRRAGFDDGP